MSIPKKIVLVTGIVIGLSAVLVAIGAIYALNIQSAKVADKVSVYDLWTLTNQQREQNGQKPLLLDPALNQTAAAKCAANVAQNTFEHDLPNGRKFTNFLPPNVGLVGENLSFSYANASDSAAIMTGWMNSPHHRDNILNPVFTKVGFATCHADQLKGLDGANMGNGELIVQHFTTK